MNNTEILGIGGRFICNNTCYVGVGNEMSADRLSWLVPPKIRKRIKLNKEGLCTMATIIIDPETCGVLDVDMLRRIGSISNEMNKEAGYPASSDLILRTSREKPFEIQRNGRYTLMSEPAMLVTNFDSQNPSFRLLNKIEGVSKISKLDEFLELIPEASFMLIHDDNAMIQRNALHGILGNVMDKYELICRIGTLHARDMGDPDGLTPTLRINHTDPNILLGVDSARSFFWGESKITTTDITTMHTVNSTNIDAKRIMGRVKKDGFRIWKAYQDTIKLFGKRAMMEFRLYSPELSEAKQRMQVMDVDLEF
jgi:hypothetical protein